MGSAWSDLERPPLGAVRLTHDLAAGTPWRHVRVVAETGSTNADLLEAARSGEPEGLVLVAEHQRSGRGRLSRQWESPPRAGLLVSMLLRPDVEPTALPLLPLLTGVAVLEAIRAVSHVTATLKWPNDVLVADRKLGGILVDRLDDAVVVGVGINVSTRADELPVDRSTSIAIESGVTDREPLLKELLRAFARRYAAFIAAKGDGDSVLPVYREVCGTIGRRVAVSVPNGTVCTGVAIAIADSGRLIVRDDDGQQHEFAAGDVVHLRLSE